LFGEIGDPDGRHRAEHSACPLWAQSRHRRATALPLRSAVLALPAFLDSEIESGLTHDASIPPTVGAGTHAAR
jgi:hypothetical protein